MGSLPHSFRRPAVLILGGSTAEWVEPGGGEPALHGRSEVGGSGPEAWARAAEAARRAAGGRRRTCLLALGEGHVYERHLELPQVARADVGRILHRKAARMLAAEPSDTLFQALPLRTLHEHQEARLEETSPWLVVAMRRSEVLPLRLALAKGGFRVAKVLPARLALYCGARHLLPSPGSPGMIIAVDPAETAIAIVEGERIHAQSVLHGDLAGSSSMSTSLLQDVRSVAGYWRKANRGIPIGQALLLGSLGERGILLERAVGAALEGAEVRLSDDSARVGSLIADAARSEELGLDLTFPLPSRPLVRAAGIVATLAVAAAAGFAGREHAERVLFGAREELSAVRALDASLDGLAGEDRRLAADLESLRLALVRAARVGSAGLPLAELLGDMRAALDGNGSLLQLHVERGSHHLGTVALEVRTSSSPFESVRSARTIAARLEASRLMKEVVIEPPTAGMEALEEGAGFPLSIRAAWGGG